MNLSPFPLSPFFQLSGNGLAAGCADIYREQLHKI
jgi:hypothetical protein